MTKSIPKEPYLRWHQDDETQPLSVHVRQKLLSPAYGLSEARLEAVEHHHRLLLSGSSILEVRQEAGGVFRDAAGDSFHYPRLRYIWFRSSGFDFGFARFCYGIAAENGFGFEAGTPFCVLLAAQGVKGVDSRKLDVNAPAISTILKHIVSSWQPLLDGQWRVGVQYDQFNQRLAEPFFEHAALKRVSVRIMATEGHLCGKYSVMPLRHPKDNRAVRALLGPAQARP